MPDLRPLEDLTEEETINLQRLSQAAHGVQILLTQETPMPIAGGFRADVQRGVGQNWNSTGMVEVAAGTVFADKVMGDGTVIPNPRILIGIEQTQSGGGHDSPSFGNVLCRLVLTPLDATPATIGLTWIEV